jgi:hypothetical protein
MRTLIALALAALVLAAAPILLLRGDDGAAAPRDGVVVWAVGDGGNGSAEARKVAGTIRADRPARVLYLGDVYEHGTAAEFRSHFASVYGSLVRRMAPTPGNHEWPLHALGYDPFWKRVKGRRLPPHYAFSLGGWRIISLNSETPANRPQLRFLRGELARRDRCVLAFMHRPRFNAGLHRAEQRDVEPLWRLLRGHADLVLSGHDHNLQRFKPVSGVTQLVIGAGGRERYPVNGNDGRLAFSDDSADGALRLLLRPGSAGLRIVRADGHLLDQTTVRC